MSANQTKKKLATNAPVPESAGVLGSEIWVTAVFAMSVFLFSVLRLSA
jgi:hypothetical protein